MKIKVRFDPLGVMRIVDAVVHIILYIDLPNFSCNIITPSGHCKTVVSYFLLSAAHGLLIYIIYIQRLDLLSPAIRGKGRRTDSRKFFSALIFRSIL